MACKHHPFFILSLLFPKSPLPPGAHEIKRKCPQDPLGSSLIIQSALVLSTRPRTTALNLSCSKTSPEHNWIWQLPELRDHAKARMQREFQIPPGERPHLLSSPWEARTPGPLALIGGGKVRVETGEQTAHTLHLTPSVHAPSFIRFLEIWVSLPADNPPLCLLSHLCSLLSSLPPPIQPLQSYAPFSMSPSEQTQTIHLLHLGGWSLAPCPFLSLPSYPPALGSCCLLPGRLDSCWAL